MLERINFYDGGVVTFAKNLSDQGKTIKEIFKYSFQIYQVVEKVNQQKKLVYKIY